MPYLLEFSARAALLAAGVAVTLVVLRIRSPRTAHRAWVGVALALIALPPVIAWGPLVAIPIAGDAPRWMAGGGHAGPAPLAGGADLALPVAIAPAATAAGVPWAGTLLALYVVGTLVFLARIIAGVIHASALRHHATLVDGRLTSARCLTPIAIGLRAPVVILPQGWTSWSGPELAAALAHEEEHVRCRDPLATLVVLVARALFWFHPLAWWLPRHTARLAEQACDAAVVARGHDADMYAASLVRFARAQAQAGCRIAATGNAMGGPALERRLRLIQNPARAETGFARLLAAVPAYAFVVGLCCTGTPVAAMAVEAGPQAPPSHLQPPAGWHAVTTEHFDVYAADEQADLMADVARQAEEAYAELRAAFRYDLTERVPLVVVGGDLQLRDATVTVAASMLPPDARAADVACEIAGNDRTLSGSCAAAGSQAGRQVILLALQSLQTRRRAIVHELTHRFAFDLVPEPSRGAPWLIEGLAEHQRGVWDADSVRGVRDAVAGRRVPDVDALAHAEGYWAHALFDFVAGSYGAEGVRRVLSALRTQPRIADAMSHAFGTTANQFNAAFRRYVSGRFGTL